MDDFIDVRENNDLIKQGFLMNLTFLFPKEMKLSFKINENIKTNGAAGPINFPLEDARIQNLLTFGNISYDFGNLNKYFSPLPRAGFYLNETLHQVDPFYHAFQAHPLGTSPLSCSGIDIESFAIVLNAEDQVWV